MALSFTVADNQDGTGGVGTIIGSAGGSANSIYYAPFQGVRQSYSLTTLGGSRVGDGTVPLPLALGTWLFQLISGTIAGPVALTSFSNVGIDPVHERILQGAQGKINLLNMTGNPPTLPNMDATRVKISWLPTAREVDLPSLPLTFISPPGFEVEEGQVINQDDFLYPVIVAIMLSQKNDSVANRKIVLKWREQILRALVRQRLPTVFENMWCVPKPMNVVDPASFVAQGILLSVLGFGFRIRQTRGLT
jgi:hypothetical protein